MIYSLQCGVCGNTSSVDSDLTAMEWNCPSCGELQTTSVPCEANGETIKTVGHGSIIAEEDPEATRSDPVGAYEKSKPVEEGPEVFKIEPVEVKEGN